MDHELKIVLTRPKSSLAIIAKIIMYIDKSKFSHIGFMWSHPRMPFNFTYESKANGGVNYTNAKEFTDHNLFVKVYSVNWTTEEKDMFTYQCSLMCRKIYGFLGVIGMGIVEFFRWMKREINNPFPFGQFCFQAGAKIMLNTFDFDTMIKPENLSPKDMEKILDRYCELYPEKVNIVYEI